MRGTLNIGDLVLIGETINGDLFSARSAIVLSQHDELWGVQGYYDVLHGNRIETYAEYQLKLLNRCYDTDEYHVI